MCPDISNTTPTQATFHFFSLEIGRVDSSGPRLDWRDTDSRPEPDGSTDSF